MFESPTFIYLFIGFIVLVLMEFLYRSQNSIPVWYERIFIFILWPLMCVIFTISFCYAFISNIIEKYKDQNGKMD